MTLADVPAPKGAGTPVVDRQARILVLDVERLPGTAYAWGPKTKYIPPRQFTQWPRLLCFAARWYGHKRPIFESEWANRDRMIERAWKLYDEADIVVTYYGIRADNPWLRTEWIEAGLPPPRPWKDVDLYRVVAQFGFESKSLDSVTRRLGRPGKESSYSIPTAVAAAEGNRKAQRELRTYNIGDVELTEWLYDRLRGWIPTHPHLGTFGDDKRCNQCGSDDLELQPTKYRAVVLDYALYRCNHCGANVRGGWQARAASTRGVRS